MVSATPVFERKSLRESKDHGKPLRKKILVVEDEVIFTLNLTDLLEMWDYEVLKPVLSAEAAIKAAEEKKPDLIIMDIGIKGQLDGIETAIKIHEKHKVPIIFISGYPYEDMKERIDAINPAFFFNKPIDISSLRAKIEEMV